MKRCSWLCVGLFLLVACGDDDRPPEGDAGTGDGAVIDTGPVPCATGTTMCGTECVDTQSSRAHCGECGTTCGAGEACIDGACGVICPSGQTVCEGACIDASSDRRHCGACGTACESGEICVEGTCELSCPAGQTLCGTACIDTTSDPRHCGACDAACESGAVCSESMCAVSCGADLTDCSAACVDVQSSPLHCGACDNACPAPAGGAGLCMAGTCRAVCDPLMGDCNADAADGCETTLATDVTNCGACGRTCSLPQAVAGCAAGACTVATCDTGYGDCDGSAANGCETDITSDPLSCGACGTVCAAGDRCVLGMCETPVGDTCANAVALSPGANTVMWNAVGLDYITSNPSCLTSGTSLSGPDVVLSYTAPADERVTIDFTKPSSTRWAAVVSGGACGTLTPELLCASDYSPTTFGGDFILAAGATAYIYVIDTDSGTARLDNPLMVNVAGADCSTPASVVSLAPASGTTTDTVSPTFTVTFDDRIDTTAGIVTISGDAGTSLSYDLSASPAEVSFSAVDTVMTIDPGIAFPPGEQLTITWSGLGGFCPSRPAIASPTWIVDVIAPPCVPGMGGVVGRTTTTFPTGISSLTEYYVAPDESPTGYVYVGGTGDLYRIPKSGGTAEDVEAAAGLTTSHLGYGMIIAGSNLYTLNDATTGTTGRIYRISTDGGTSFGIFNYATFPTAPTDDFRSGTVYGGRIYLLTEEDTASTPTQIWSMEADAASVPTTPTLDLEITGETDCTAIDRDTSFYYLVCGDPGDRVIRVPVAGGTPVLISDTIPVSTLNSGGLRGDDLDADGVFDVLYIQTEAAEVYYVCDPADASPYVDTLVSFGASTTSNYGMGFDRGADTLWTFDDDTRDFVTIE